MVAEPKRIELNDRPELRKLVAEVREANAPIELTKDGELQAVLEPPRRAPGEPGRLTASEREAFRGTWGAWDGFVDSDQWIRDIYESRSILPSPLPDLFE